MVWYVHFEQVLRERENMCSKRKVVGLENRPKGVDVDNFWKLAPSFRLVYFRSSHRIQHTLRRSDTANLFVLDCPSLFDRATDLLVLDCSSFLNRAADLFMLDCSSLFERAADLLVLNCSSLFDRATDLFVLDRSSLFN